MLKQMNFGINNSRQETNFLHETHVLPGATDGDGREVQFSDGVGRRLQCGDHLQVKWLRLDSLTTYMIYMTIYCYNLIYINKAVSVCT